MPKTKKPIDLCSQVIAYENGEMKPNEMLEFFSELVRTGKAWQFQGHYGRTASDLIRSGHLDRTGKILKRFTENA